MYIYIYYIIFAIHIDSTISRSMWTRWFREAGNKVVPVHEVGPENTVGRGSKVGRGNTLGAGNKNGKNGFGAQILVLWFLHFIHPIGILGWICNGCNIWNTFVRHSFHCLFDPSVKIKFLSRTIIFQNRGLVFKFVFSSFSSNLYTIMCVSTMG